MVSDLCLILLFGTLVGGAASTSLSKSEVHIHMAFDFGFFNGDDTNLLLSQGYRVVAVEANPILWSQGRKRFSRDIDEGRLHLLHLGLPIDKGDYSASTHKNTTFYISQHNPQWSSFHREVGCRSPAHFRMAHDPLGPENCKAIPIRVASCTHILSQFGVPVIMKLDVEGGEWSCVRALQNLPLRPSYIVIEKTPEYDFDLMASLGYDSFKYVNQGFRESEWGESSGPLGEYGLDCEYKWKWRDVASATQVTREMNNGPAFERSKHPTCNLWADIHARHEDTSKLFRTQAD